MVCQTGCNPWRTTSRQQLPDLSQPQATVWARGSFGMGLARSCALTAVRHLLAQGLRRTEQTGRQPRRAWDDDTPRKRGAKHSTSRPAVRPCGEGWCAGGRARHGPGPWRPPRWGHALWGGPSAWSSAGVPSRWRGGACHTRLAAGGAAAVAAAAPGAPAGLDGARVGRSWPGGALAVATPHPPGRASVCAPQPRRQRAAHWGAVVAPLADRGAAAGHARARHGPRLDAASGRRHVAGPLGRRRQSPRADPDRSAARGQ